MSKPQVNPLTLTKSLVAVVFSGARMNAGTLGPTEQCTFAYSLDDKLTDSSEIKIAYVDARNCNGKEVAPVVRSMVDDSIVAEIPLSVNADGVFLSNVIRMAPVKVEYDHEDQAIYTPFAPSKGSTIHQISYYPEYSWDGKQVFTDFPELDQNSDDFSRMRLAANAFIIHGQLDAFNKTDVQKPEPDPDKPGEEGGTPDDGDKDTGNKPDPDPVERSYNRKEMFCAAALSAVAGYALAPKE